MSAPSRSATMFHILIDPSVAKAAFERLAPRLHALRRDELVAVRGDVQTAAAFALSVARDVSEPEVRARFARLGESGEYDDACTAGLARAALSTWYARHRALLAVSSRAPVHVPVTLLDEALALRSRLVEGTDRPAPWLGGGGARQARIGASFEDLAADLVSLGTACAHVDVQLGDDDRALREEEALRARELGEELLERMCGASALDPSSWGALSRRAFTLLDRTYGEVRRAGRFLFAGEEGEVRFPPLASVALAPRPALSLPQVYPVDPVAERGS